MMQMNEIRMSGNSGRTLEAGRMTPVMRGTTTSGGDVLSLADSAAKLIGRPKLAAVPGKFCPHDWGLAWYICPTCSRDFSNKKGDIL
jgi:hypothetical protein